MILSRRTIATCLSLVPALLWGCAAKNLQARSGDYDYVLSISDLSDYMGTSEYPLDLGVLIKRRTPMGAYELAYEYDSENPPLYLYWELIVHRDTPRAREYYRSGGAGIRIGSALAPGVSFVQDEYFVIWGDSSAFYTIEAEGEPVGSGFWARSGRRTLLFLVAGVYFDSSESFDDLVRPKLTKALTFQPDPNLP